MQLDRWRVVLVLLLLSGCAAQPYPSLPPDVPVQSGSEPQPRAEPVAPIADLASRGAGAADGEGGSLPPPVSQEVRPPPPEPGALPAADKRQLDIRLASQRFNYFEDDQLVWTGPISSGTPEYPTPKGSFKVQAKDVDKRSGSYTNYFEQPTPMPYALQFLGPYWVHEGYVTGEPESHGCVRLRHADARFVFERMKVGDRIVVAD
jgi:lipoprotein-anchoring transpeptidase ErfK/SrfK